MSDQGRDRRGIQELFFGDLDDRRISGLYWGAQLTRFAHLQFGICPTRDLDNHVENGLLLVGVQRNVVEGRDGDAILLNVGSELAGVESSNLAQLKL